MYGKLFIYILILHLCQDTFQNEDDNLVEISDDTIDSKSEEDPMKNIGGAINNFMNTDGGKQLGDMIMGASKNINNFMQTDGGKQIGDMLMGAASNKNEIVSDILKGVGNLMQDKPKGETGGGGGSAGSGGAGAGGIGSGLFDGLSPEVMGILNMMANQQQSMLKSTGGSLDMNAIIQALLSLSNQGSPINYLNLIPKLIQSVTTFVGPEAEKREQEHTEHAWMLPPFLEKLHVTLDHFLHSEMGMALMESTGANRALKLFSDENGKFSYPKFVEMFENHSFRKHWISMATRKIADTISYFADPYTQKKFITTFQLFANNFLRGQGVPKTALFDPTRPTESLSSLVNFYAKKYLGQKIDAKKYVQPLVKYIQELLGMAEDKGLVGTGVDSSKLSHKIADTINLEIIEPIVRVNRAYRFARKVPKCDRYVMCLVNEEEPQEAQSIPGLKISLSRIASLVASWFLSGEGGTPFWSLYHVISEENNCQARYLDQCHEFHVDEIRVTTEYLHNEL